MIRWFVIASVFIPTVALGHGGLPSIAPIEAPRGVGIVVDEAFEVRWTDLDQPVPTGTATVDLFFTRRRPPTFGVGEIPADLDGVAIVTGILEKDPTNRFRWDTQNVPAGSYWVWSFVNEPPSERDPFPVVSFSQGVVTVAHPGDAIRPAIVLTSPETPYDYAHEAYVVRYEAFDPDGTGKVTIEPSNGTERIRIADRVVAAASGAAVWETVALAEGDWVLSATIADDRGFSFTAHGTYPVWITHQTRPAPDAGASDASGTNFVDGGGDVAVDGGSDAPPTPRTEPAGCRCVPTRTTWPPTWPIWLVVLSGGWARTRRSRGACRPGTRG